MDSTAKAIFTAHWGGAESDVFAPLEGGLINRTWLVTSTDKKYVMQWVNPIFPQATTEDVAQVCQWLNKEGLPAFEVIPAKAGSLSIVGHPGSWRVLSFLEGQTISRDADFTSSASFLAQFHTALSTYPHPFRHSRDIHNTQTHVAFLRETCLSEASHPFFPDVVRLASVVESLIAEYMPPEGIPRRIVHGDPKLENFLMTRRGPCLIDLDTVGRHTLFGEIGDAVRSWCSHDGLFSLARYETFMAAYAGGKGFELSATEKQSLGFSHITIALELTARFLADALNESYFGWDSSAYSRAAEHNVARARIQLRFAQSALGQVGKTHNIASGI